MCVFTQQPFGPGVEDKHLDPNKMQTPSSKLAVSTSLVLVGTWLQSCAGVLNCLAQSPPHFKCHPTAGMSPEENLLGHLFSAHVLLFCYLCGAVDLVIALCCFKADTFLTEHVSFCSRRPSPGLQVFSLPFVPPASAALAVSVQFWVAVLTPLPLLAAVLFIAVYWFVFGGV